MNTTKIDNILNAINKTNNSFFKGKFFYLYLIITFYIFALKIF